MRGATPRHHRAYGNADARQGVAVGSETKPAAADLPFLGPRRAQEGRRGLLSWACGWGLSPFSVGK